MTSKVRLFDFNFKRCIKIFFPIKFFSGIFPIHLKGLYMNNRSMIPFTTSKASSSSWMRIVYTRRSYCGRRDFGTRTRENPSYLYNPEMQRMPDLFPATEGGAFKQEVWLRFSNKIIVEFEDDLTPAIRICFHHPEEIIEFIEFLEVATHENLFLRGKNPKSRNGLFPWRKPYPQR